MNATAPTPIGPPREVRTAFRLYLADIALGVLGTASSFLLVPQVTRGIEHSYRAAGQTATGAGSQALIGLGVLAGVTLLFLAAQLAVVFRMRAGRNWARVTLLVLSAVQLVVLGLGVGQTGLGSGVVGVLSAVLRIVVIVVLLAATSFLFRPAAVRWFRGPQA